MITRSNVSLLKHLLLVRGQYMELMKTSDFDGSYIYEEGRGETLTKSALIRKVIKHKKPRNGLFRVIFELWPFHAVMVDSRSVSE